MTIAIRRRPTEPDRWLDECERRIEPQITGCWLWLGARHRSGHGRLELHVEGVEHHWYAHRLVYELMVADVPAELVLDHLCRNRSCVNPLHLEVVTNGENVLRGESFAALNAAKTKCPAGHPLEGENLFVGKQGGRRCRICMREACRRWGAANPRTWSESHGGRTRQSRREAPAAT